jgi:glucose/arabinose dehydrogenase
MKAFLIVGAVALIGCTDSEARTSAGDAAKSAAEKSDAASTTQSGSLRLTQIGDRFRSPVYLTSPPGDPRLFVVEQAGRIVIVRNGSALSEPFLDISSRVKSGGEQGLLSMAFHPDHRTNGQFFVNFTDRQGDTHVERFTVTTNPDVADPQSAKLVISIDQPYSNHNGGHVLFGPDGMLYIGMGDGGSGGDPRGNGQNPNALLGKILRLNVSRTEPYSIPVGNPFAAGSRGRPEIWATGVRNPWRLAFDRTSGLLYIADVGQNEIEEVNVVQASRAGVNYGWNVMEGDKCYRANVCNRDGIQMPALTYDHSGGACSITGGYVYRGRAVPSIAGHYFYSDYCSGWIRSFRFQNGRAVDRREWRVDNLGHVVSFGEDSSGELYIVGENGRIWRISGAG